MPIQTGGATPAAWASANQTLVDIGSIVGTNGQPVDRHLCGSAADPNGSDNPLPANSLTGAIALVSRGIVLVRLEGGSRAGRRARSGSSSSTTASARRTAIPVQLQIPGGMIADIDGAALRAAMGSAGRIQIRIGRGVRGHRDRTQRHRDELLVAPGRRRSGTCSSPTSPLPAGRSSPRRCRVRRLAVRRVRRDEHGDAARRRARRRCSSSGIRRGRRSRSSRR